MRHGASSLLTGPDVAAWEEWCRQAGRFKPELQPNTLQIEFVKASAHAKRRRRQLLLLLALLVAVTIVGFSIWALLMREVAVQQRNRAVEARAEAEIAAAKSYMFLLLRDVSLDKPAELRATLKAAEIAQRINSTDVIRPRILSILGDIQHRQSILTNEFTPPVSANSIISMAWARAGDDHVLACGFSDGNIVVWEYPDGKLTNNASYVILPFIYYDHDAVVSVAWGSYENQALLLATTSSDGLLSVWKTSSTSAGSRSFEPFILTLPPNTSGVSSLAWSCAAKPTLAVMTTDGSILLWQYPLLDALPVVLQPEEARSGGAISFSPDCQLLASATETGNGSDIWVWPISSLDANASEQRSYLVGTHKGKPAAVSWINQTVLATASNAYFSTNMSDIKLWLLEISSVYSDVKAELVQELSPGFKINSIDTYRNDRHSFVAASGAESSGVVQLWKLASSSEQVLNSVNVSAAEDVPAVVRFSPQGVLTTGHGSKASDSCRFSSVRMWATSPVIPYISLEYGSRPNTSGCCLSWLGDMWQPLLASASISSDARASTVSVWNVSATDGQEVLRGELELYQRWTMPGARVSSLSGHPNRPWLAVGVRDTVYILEVSPTSQASRVILADDEALWKITVGEGGQTVTSMEWSASGSLIACGREDGSIFVLKMAESLSRSARLNPGGALPLFTQSKIGKHSQWGVVSWAPDGMLATAGRDGKVAVMSDNYTATAILNAENYTTDDWAETAVKSLMWSADSKSLIVAMADGTMVSWRPGSDEAPAKLHQIGSGCAGLSAAALSPDGGLVLSGQDDGVVRLQRVSTSPSGDVQGWNLAGAPTSASGQTLRAPVQDVAFSVSGQHLAYMTMDGSVEVMMPDFQHLTQVLRGLTIGQLSARDLADLGLPSAILKV